MSKDNELSTIMFTYSGNTSEFSGFLFYDDNLNKYMVNDRGEIVDNNSIKFGLEKESFIRRINLSEGEIGETQSNKNKNRMVYVNEETLVGEVGIIYNEDTLKITTSSNGDNWKDKYYVEFIDLEENKKIQLIVDLDLTKIIYPNPNNSGYSITKEDTDINFNITDDNNKNKVVYAYRSRSINSEEFISNIDLLGIHLTSKVTEIGGDAFYGCEALAEVIIPNSVTTIGEKAFANCRGLIQITIPNNVTIIALGTFFNCIKLTQVTIPNSITAIGVQAFANCRGLTQVTIPNNVTEIGDFVFETCTALEKIIIEGNLEIIGLDAFVTHSEQNLKIQCNQNTANKISMTTTNSYEDKLEFIIVE